MENSTESESQRPLPKWIRVLGAILATILLGAAGSGLWDILFKPGLSTIGRIFLTIFTLGSQRLKDYAYQSAALNPTMLPGLLWILFLTVLPLAFFTNLIIFTTLLSYKSQNKKSNGTKKQSKTPLQADQKSIKSQFSMRIKITIMVIFLVVSFISVTGFMVLNQSILVWRVFQSNMAICGPCLTVDQEKQIRAKFATMVSSSDYQEIAKELKEISSKCGVKLLDYRLW